VRILFLAPQPFYEVRGTPLAVAALTRALAELGHRIDLLTFPQGETRSSPGVNHLRSMRLAGPRVRPGFSIGKALQDLPFALRARRLAASGAYDVVHAVEESAALVASAIPTKTKFVVDMDSDLGEQLANSKTLVARWIGPAAARLHDLALQRADLAIVINTRLAEAAHRVSPQLPVHILQDPPLVSALTDADSAAAADLRRDLAIGDSPVALYTGNFERYQGVDVMAAAAAHVDGAIFVFVGGETDDIDVLKTSLPAPVLSRCRFVGKKPPEELPRWMALADVLVSPRTLGGNTPFKIYTYLASGRAIVATDLDTHTQVLSHETAFLAPPTAEGLAVAIREALADPASRARRAANGLALLEREYSRERFKEKVAAAYATLE
jgi:glycosyltransferase involved in cell wall biosynthesis